MSDYVRRVTVCNKICEVQHFNPFHPPLWFNILTSSAPNRSDDLLLMNTPPPASKVRHPAARALEEKQSHESNKRLDVHHEDVDKMLACSPLGGAEEVRADILDQDWQWLINV